MQIRVITLRYDNETQGFNDEDLRKATYNQEILSEEHHIMTVGNVPHITFILTMVGASKGKYGSNGDKGSTDRGGTRAKMLESQMGEATKKAYNALKKWRNDIIRKTGAPSYEIARNHQLAEMALRAPKTLLGLREVKGIGESFTKQYGEEVLKLMVGLAPTSFDEPDAQQTETKDDSAKKKKKGEDDAVPESESETGMEDDYLEDDRVESELVIDE